MTWKFSGSMRRRPPRPRASSAVWKLGAGDLDYIELEITSVTTNSEGDPRRTASGDRSRDHAA